VSIIEKAARRLEELGRAGVDVAGVTRGPRQPLQPESRPSPAEAAPAAPATDDAGPRVVLDLALLASRGVLTPDAPRTRLADEYRVIKRPLLLNARGASATPVADANRIMVTSSLPGEGKTFTAINLAMSIAAEIDTSVMLIDADVIRPAVFGRLGLPTSKGLLDLVTDPAVRLDDVVLRTNIDRLTLLPAGTSQSHSTELLASDAMVRRVEEIAARWPERVLIFDAPPLLPSTESRVLATHMGQIVMVVEAETTLQSTVVDALATIEQCPVVMTLLNKLSGKGDSSYYGYYGHYGQP
jgi:exopolysaccharide/PEP-CTERM locus tyrosine autokinase